MTQNPLKTAVKLSGELVALDIDLGRSDGVDLVRIIKDGILQLVVKDEVKDDLNIIVDNRATQSKVILIPLSSFFVGAMIGYDNFKIVSSTLGDGDIQVIVSVNFTK